MSVNRNRTEELHSPVHMWVTEMWEQEDGGGRRRREDRGNEEEEEGGIKGGAREREEDVFHICVESVAATSLNKSTMWKFSTTELLSPVKRDWGGSLSCSPAADWFLFPGDPNKL